MEKLRIKIGKKKTVSAMVDEFTIGGTTDHNLLKNRDMNNQHPINAINGLEDALNVRVTNEELIAEVNSALKSAKESGLFNGKDGKDGHTPQKGIDYFDGESGNDGVGILSIEQESASSTDGGENIIKITLTDGRVQRFIIKNGSGGEVEISQYDVINALGYTPIDRENIVDDLETNIANYPLSAAQGAKLKRLIDDITVPTKTSQLTNDSKFMSTEEVVAKINEAISGVAGGLKFEIVDEVPTVWGDGNTIYLVPSEDTEDNQYYDEYMFIESKGTWERLGDTRVNLAPYYTELEVDNLIYNVQKSIPTKMSQLYNDVDYVKASELETGEATWNSIKGNIIERVGTPVTWDGNTEGREVYEMKGSITGTFYKVSDIVVKAEDIVGCSYYTQVGGATEKIVPERGTGALFGLADNEHMWMLIAAGMVCLYDDSQGCSPGLYFNVGPYEYDNTKTEFVTKLIVEHDKIKPELLPDIMETVGSDTLTWDGNTEGRYNALNLAFLISDTVPTFEELKKGGILINNSGKEIPFTESSIIDAEAFGMGTGCYIIVDSVQYPSVFVVYEENATFGIVKDGQTISGVLEKKGVYFVDGTLVGVNSYVTSLTINGYSFKKEVIKEEYLPPSVPREGMTVKRREFTSHADLHSFLSENCENVLKAMLRLLYEEAGTVYIEDMVYTSVSKLDYGDSYSFALSKNEYNFGFDSSTTPDLYFTAGRIEVKENGGHFSHGNYWLKHSADTGFTYEADEDATSMNFDDEILASMGGRYIIFYAD